MSSVEKVRKKKKESKSASRSTKIQHKKDGGGIPAIEEPAAVTEARLGTSEGTREGENVASVSKPGSVISVRDANDSAKTGLQNNGPETESSTVKATDNTTERPPSGRPKSASKTSPQTSSQSSITTSPPSSKPSSRPQSAASQRPGSATVHPAAGPTPVSKSIPDFTADSSRPPSVASRAFLPPDAEIGEASAGRPASATKTGKIGAVGPAGSAMGSAVSLQSRTSREVWVNGDETAEKDLVAAGSRPATATQRSRPASAAQSIISVGQASNANRLDGVTEEAARLEVVPADMNEAHAYVPYVYARDCIARMMEDMKLMKRKHITIVTDIEDNYQNIEKETQGQFNTFVLTLRQQYGVKVKTFRQVIEVHRAELQHKQQHWDEALISLSNKNKQLLSDKKALLIQNKVEHERLTKDKEDALHGTLADNTTKGHEIEKLRQENKILEDQLDSEKGENERLKTEIDALKNRPVTKQSERLVTAAPGDSGGHVIVTDMSQEERTRMENERRQTDRERDDMKRERARLEKEREEFSTERSRFTEETISMQGAINTAKGDSQVWHIKHDALRAQLADSDDWRKRYEVLLAQYEAVTAVAEVNTQEEKQKTEEKIASCTTEKNMMQEETERVKKEVKEWENSFRKQHGRAPTQADRSDSAQESYDSLEEATHMCNKLTAQIVALEALKRGDIPPPPKVEKEVIEIKETEVKTVEIKVPDPELLAHIEMTQQEMDALKQQLSAMKNDKSDLSSANSQLQQQLSEQNAHIAQLQATLDALNKGEKADTDAVVAVQSAPVAAAPVSSGDSEETAELEKQIREKNKELREAEIARRDAARESENAKRGLEKDLKQALRALAKAEKGSSREERRLKDLLAIVAAQVREVNSAVNKAAQEVDSRLASAHTRCEQSKEQQQQAKQQYDAWEIGWAEENGREPGVNDVDGDSEGSKLHKALSSANKTAEEADMLVEALTLIKTGAVPESRQEEAALEKASPAVRAAQARPATAAESASDAEIEALEQTISELEKQAQQLEDEITDTQQERDLVHNENKELEDRHAELLAEIEKLRAQIQDLKLNEQELIKQAEETRIAHDVELREQAREHTETMETREEEHKGEKREMEKDIRKLCKLIDKLKKKMAEKEATEAAPASDQEALLKEKEKLVDDLEDKVAELEDKMADFENDKKQMKVANQKLEEKLEVVTKTLTTTETEMVELGASASAATAAQSEAKELRDDLEALRKRIKELEREVRVKNKELREQQFQYEKDIREKEREQKEMKNDIEKLVKLMDRLRKRSKELANEKEKLLDDVHELNEDVKDRDFELEWMRKNPQLERPEKLRPKQKREEDYEEVITELRTKVQYLEDDKVVQETESDDFKTDYQHTKAVKQELESKVEELEVELTESRRQIADLTQAAAAQKMLDRANTELDQLRRRLRTVEGEVREREREVKDKDIALRSARAEHERQLRERENTEREMKSDMKKLMKEIQKLMKKNMIREGPDLAAVSESDEEVARLEKELDEAEDKLQELQYKVSDLQAENGHLQSDKNVMEEENKKLEGRVEALRRELELERERIQQSVRPLSGHSPVPMLASTPDAMGGIDLEDYTRQIDTLQQQVDEAERRVREEKQAHEATKEQLDTSHSQLHSMKVELENERSEAAAKQDAAISKKQSEIDNLNKKLTESRARLEGLEQEKLKALPPDATKEIASFKQRLAASERECDGKEAEKAELSAKVRELIAKIKSLENSTKTAKTHGNDAEVKMKAIKAEKEREMKRLQADADKKERERALQERKKITALEQKIRELEYASTPGGAAKIATTKANVAKGDNKVLEERMRETRRENNELNARMKQMEKELKTARNAGSGAASDITTKKQEKLVAELMKKLDDMTERKKKLEETVTSRDSQIKGLDKEGKKKDTEIERLKAELAQLGVAAKAAVESESKRKEMEKELKHLREDNKSLNDNYNSERVLRKKYYNMVEDMKGKIRVYTRVRPMSGSELERGNHNIAKSPDEYTIQLETGRGMKEWQFDQIFMPESAQEKVFEDTNNLIQSAVDGYNVCIFAYGQTGSGKTFTIIGDRQQKFPGIAPRAFSRIFELLEENKAKFSYSVSCYMLELYNDKLLDLFARPGANQDDKLEIKKDKKGMVVVMGSEVKPARNPKELFALFDQGTQNRHTASTKMNAESSRSHLVIGIIIETTNRTSGTVMRGKLSLVDLAGSERAAKTGAGAEQLKEAMSINKSLSALGDVISALSSEQSFIPYRNNKLTMLMQDSLGGNAKTLMFVNISPADYNAEESAISLTYASRVKLITNDAQKNADNKEINRLKSIISKMKSGQTVEEDADA